MVKAYCSSYYIFYGFLTYCHIMESIQRGQKGFWSCIVHSFLAKKFTFMKEEFFRQDNNSDYVILISFCRVSSVWRTTSAELMEQLSQTEPDL